jgi:cytochrome P450
MLMNPAAQDQAQEEIDRVIGTDRLPTFDDESKLPFVSALSKEVFRWQQVAPFGMRPRPLRAPSPHPTFLHSSDPASSDGRRHLQRVLHPQRLDRSWKRMVRIIRDLCAERRQC